MTSAIALVQLQNVADTSSSFETSQEYESPWSPLIRQVSVQSPKDLK